jgi:hypothetical protein
MPGALADGHKGKMPTGNKCACMILIDQRIVANSEKL